SGARQRRGSRAGLAPALALATEAFERLSRLRRGTAEVHGKVAGLDAFDGETSHAVREASLVAQLEEETPALPGEDRAEHFELPTDWVREPSSRESDDEVRLRLVQPANRDARRGDRLLLWRRES